MHGTTWQELRSRCFSAPMAASMPGRRHRRPLLRTLTKQYVPGNHMRKQEGAGTLTDERWPRCRHCHLDQAPCIDLARILQPPQHLLQVLTLPPHAQQQLRWTQAVEHCYGVGDAQAWEHDGGGGSRGISKQQPGCVSGACGSMMRHALWLPQRQQPCY